MPSGFLRATLGVLCMAFAHLFGRSVVQFYRGRGRKSRTLAAALRTIATGLAVAWRVGFDGLTVAVLILAILSFAAGAHFERRPKRHEELDKIMFPPE